MRDLRAIAAWLMDEARAAGRFLSEYQLWAALGCGLLLWSLAYQVPYSYRIDIGGNQQTLRQHDDDPYLADFNEPEPAKLYIYKNHDKVPFRWTTEHSSISLPGLGGGHWNIALKASSGRPDKSSVTSRWSDGTTTSAVTVDAQQQIYRFVAATQAGDLNLQFDTPRFVAPGDRRDSLGLVMFRLTAQQDGGPLLPAPRQLVLLAATLALTYLLLRRLAIAPGRALAVVLGLALLAALLLAQERTTVTLIAPRLPLILIGVYLFSLVLDLIFTRLLIGPGFPLAHGETVGAATLPIIGLIALALTLRLGGLLHPHTRSSDDGLNANNLLGFTTGEVYFTEGLPSESGGGPAPYPPGQYITFAPARLIASEALFTRKIFLRIANALWDSLSVGVLWYLLRRSGYRQRTSLLGAALYVLPPPILVSLSIGEFANIFGQGMGLLLLTMLALHARDLQRPRTFGVAVAVLALPLLSHLGVTISLVCVLGYLGLIWTMRAEHRRATAALVLAGVIVGALLLVFFYAPFADILRARFNKAPDPASVSTATFMKKLNGQWRLAYGLGIQPLLVTLGGLGAILTAFRGRRWGWGVLRPALGSLLMAWWGGTLLSLSLLVFANQGVRWQAFFYPALCLGAGPGLAQFWPRGRAGRLAATLLFGFLLWYGLDFWVDQLRSYSP